MIRATAAVLSLMMTLPVLADDIVVTIDNQSSQMVDRVNTFPVGDDGEAIEDNLGSTGDIMPGTTGTYSLASTKCELVRVYIGMADQSELNTDLNLCKARTVVVTD